MSFARRILSAVCLPVPPSGLLHIGSQFRPDSGKFQFPPHFDAARLPFRHSEANVCITRLFVGQPQNSI